MTIEAIGVNFVAPLLSTVTAGFLFWFGKTHLRSIRTLESIEVRVESHEKRINKIEDDIQGVIS